MDVSPCWQARCGRVGPGRRQGDGCGKAYPQSATGSMRRTKITALPTPPQMMVPVKRFKKCNNPPLTDATTDSPPPAQGKQNRLQTLWDSVFSTMEILMTKGQPGSMKELV